jgi:NADH:ubiquinone reductase (H+-translocating)
VAKARIVIIGGGFSGYHCAEELTRLSRGKADLVMINPTDYFLYFPLLPQVAGGLLDPLRVTVSLPETLRHVRLVLGQAQMIDFDTRRVHVIDPEDRTVEIDYDRLVIAAGSVNKLLPIPGIADHAHGFRGMAEAMYLHDHLTRQVELARTTDDEAERAARLTFVVVGAGYTGTEVLVHGQRLTNSIMHARSSLAGSDTRWVLIDTADRVLPGLDERLSRSALRVLKRRNVDVRLGTSVEEATRDGVRLSDGTFVSTRTLVWCVGVRPDQLVDDLGLATKKGRLVVDEYLNVPGYPDVFACGDAAGVPDLTRPGELTAMTAQHAERQGKLAARNVAASLGGGKARAYRHHELGFVVDLGAPSAAADPLGVAISGPLAAAVTAGYHLLTLPANRGRVANDWLIGALTKRQAVQLGLVRGGEVPLDTRTPEHPPRRSDSRAQQKS